MKKIGLISILSTVLLFNLFSGQALASNNDVKEEVLRISEKTDKFEVISTEELPEGTPTVNFDSIEEFEAAIADLQDSSEETEVEEFFESDLLSDNAEVKELSPSIASNQMVMAAVSTKYGEGRIKWMVDKGWNPIKNQLYPPSMFIDFGYKYTGSGSSKKFSSITKITSDCTGVATHWVQSTKGSSTFYDSNRGVTIKIQGYHLLGLNIAGQSIGTKFPEVYTKKYHF